MGRCGILVIAAFMMTVFGAEPVAAQSSTGLSELSAAKRKPSSPRRAANDDDKNGDDKKGDDKDDKPDTENIFGFTAGTDIGEVGEKEIESDTVGRFGKRDGSYRAVSQKFEVGYTPTRNFHFALGASLAHHRIANVSGLDDRSQVAFEGLSFEGKFRLIERELAGVGLTFIVEPEWARIDDTSGARVSKFGSEFKLAADAELVKEKVYAAMNLLYEPERQRDLASGEVERESTLGVFGAVSFQVAKGVFLGGEVRYLQKYEGLAFDHKVGDALFVGPTFYTKLSERFWIAAAWNIQVAGRSSEMPDQRLDLDHFSRHEARLKAGLEF